MSASFTNEVVWIIGASSGIGASLARELSARGARLALSARRVEQLDALCKELGSHHQSFALDVVNAEHVKQTTQRIVAELGRVDRVIFMSAAYQPMRLDVLDLATTKQIVDVNLMGAFYVIDAVLPILQAQSKGQIALCGSVAGYVGLPKGQPYSATKAAIINLAQSLRAELPASLDVKLISPGFVRTELTDKNDFAMPMIIEPAQAAKIIADGLLSTSFEIHFPKRFTTLLKLLQMLPHCCQFALTKKL